MLLLDADDEAVIDLHTHVLPGIDDGPSELVGSVAMADVASTDGVSVLVATPHLRADYPGVVPEEFPHRIAQVHEALARYAIELSILPGAEVDLEAALALGSGELRLVTLGGNGNDLLVETPHSRLPPDFEAKITRVREKGFRVTLAHPELNPDLQADPQRLGRMVADGVLVQLSSSSLLANRRSPARSAAHQMLESGWSHVVASDAHAPRWRPPTLKSQVDEVVRSRSELAAVLHWATGAAPKAILQGTPLPTRPSPGSRRRRLLRR